MVGAISKRTHCTGTCMSQYDVQLQASICLQSIVILFEHRGEGTNLEFGKRCNAYRTLDLFLLRNGDNCPHFAAPSCGRAVADSQNFWRRHRTGGLWRTRKTFGASNENAFL